MRAIIPQVPEDILALRTRTGADRWDEMWKGVLHMPPMPNREHQNLEFALEAYLRMHWAPSCGGRVYHQINVAARAGCPNDYRIPDLVLLTPERFAIDRNEYFEGGPDVVVEIRSPGDESYEKLEFYAQIGVNELWIIDRDTRVPEIHALVGGSLVKQVAGRDGWLLSRATGVELKVGGSAKLMLRLAGREGTRQELP
jgi:Uma2 family endonuclease